MTRSRALHTLLLQVEQRLIDFLMLICRFPAKGWVVIGLLVAVMPGPSQ